MPLYFIRHVNKSGWSGVVVKACSSAKTGPHSEVRFPHIPYSSSGNHYHWWSVCQKVIGSSHTGTSKQSLAIEMQKPLHNAPFINHFSYSHFYELIRYNLLLVVPSKTLLLLVVPKIHEWSQAYLPAPIVGLNINCFHEPAMATEFLPSRDHQK